MHIKVFGKQNCDQCMIAVRKFEDFTGEMNIRDSVSLAFMDMETIDGLAEGSFYKVTKIPTTIIEKGNSLMARWDGTVPVSDEFTKFFEHLVPESPLDIN